MKTTKINHRRAWIAAFIGTVCSGATFGLIANLTGVDYVNLMATAGVWGVIYLLHIKGQEDENG